MNDDSKLPICPFYGKETNNRLHCEGSTIKPPDKEARREIVYKYCASMENYKNCTIYQMLMNYYNRMYQNRKG